MEPIEIMPKREGSGPEGTRELLSVGSPLLAALNLTPIGRGLLGAIGTMATIPEESEAGIFTILPKLSKKGRVNLIDEGAAVFPDMTRNVEFPTSGMAQHIDKTGKANLRTLADSIRSPALKDLSPEDVTRVQSAYLDLKKVPVFARDEKKMMSTAGITDTTNAFFIQPNVQLPHGKIAIKHKLGTGEAVPSSLIASAGTHEFTHAADMLDTTMTKILRENNGALDYNFNLGESRAFIAGSRQGMDKTITDPSSPDFLHPMLSYGGGRISVAPALDFINNIRHSYKAIGKEVDDKYIDDYLITLRDEGRKVQERVNTNPNFRAKLDFAMKDLTDSNAQWIFDNPQKFAHKARQEQLKGN